MLGVVAVGGVCCSGSLSVPGVSTHHMISTHKRVLCMCACVYSLISPVSNGALRIMVFGFIGCVGRVCCSGPLSVTVSAHMIFTHDHTFKSAFRVYI